MITLARDMDGCIGTNDMNGILAEFCLCPWVQGGLWQWNYMHYTSTLVSVALAA